MDESFQQKIQKDALDATVKAIQQKIATLSCPDHHQKPQLKFSEGSGAGEQKMSFDCCCNRLGEMVQKAMEA